MRRVGARRSTARALVCTYVGRLMDSARHAGGVRVRANNSSILHHPGQYSYNKPFNKSLSII